MTFSIGDRVRILTLPEHTAPERALWEGKTATVVATKEHNIYTHVELDEYGEADSQFCVDGVIYLRDDEIELMESKE